MSSKNLTQLSTNNIEQADLEDLLSLMEAKEQELLYNKLATRFPDEGKYSRKAYDKHIQFINASSQFPQRAFLGGNRTGKTETAAYEMAVHLTGKYPKWWQGVKFLNPIEAWAAGISNKDTKDIVQKALFGPEEDIGSGMIPKEDIGKIAMKAGVTDAIGTAKIRHISGGWSTITFKSYEERRPSFQGTKKQVIWLDEEPTIDPTIYTECVMRLMDEYRPGLMMCTFTPLSGLSDVALKFVPNLIANGPCEHDKYKFAIQVSWDDVPHIPDDEKEKMWAECSPHERLARSKGIPSLGSGAIYPYLEEDITCKPFQIPEWWPKVYGMDTGWHRTAAVWGAQDPDTKIIYIYSEHYLAEAHPAIHASAIKTRGNWIIGASDPAGANISDGRKIFDLYVEEGLDIVKAEKQDREGGILKVSQMFASGQLKIFTSLGNTLNEIRRYRRDEKGDIVKKNDHAMDAMRYLLTTGINYMTRAGDNDDSENYSSSGGRDSYTGY